jgi:hypothetical protein
MARRSGDSGQLPWPTKHLCDDGKVRNLAEYVPREWVGCTVRVSWRGERARMARSLGRKVLPEIIAMTVSTETG